MGTTARATGIDRTNGEWLAALRCPVDGNAVIEELQVYLRATLARILRARNRFEEADLDDFTQDALMRILDRLDSFRGDSRFTTWAIAVAVRVAIDALRLRRRGNLPLEELDPGTAMPLGAGPQDDPERALNRRTLLDSLHRAIHDALTERQRVAVLGELAGAPPAVLAERLKTNPNALYKLRHDARKKLKRALNETGYSDEDVRQELRAAGGA